MPELLITPHAVERYRERVQPVSISEAERALSTRAFQAATDYPRCAVILPSGHRAVMRFGAVITVLPLGSHVIFSSRNHQGDL